MDVISTFLRALCAGALHIRHGAVLLAHHGRLGSAFDVCSKVVVDVLREEGMMKTKGDVVALVVTQALREVRITNIFGTCSDIWFHFSKGTHTGIRRYNSR
jgi:cohesin complex subunit SA-1/2